MIVVKVKPYHHGFMYLCPFSMYNLFFSISSQLSLNTYEMLKGKSGVKQKAKPNIKVSELQLCVFIILHA